MKGKEEMIKERRGELIGYSGERGTFTIYDQPYMRIALGILLDETPKQLEDRLAWFFDMDSEDKIKYKTLTRYTNEYIRLVKGKTPFKQIKF